MSRTQGDRFAGQFGVKTKLGLSSGLFGGQNLRLNTPYNGTESDAIFLCECVVRSAACAGHFHPPIERESERRRQLGVS